jgi:glyoxylase-like metal-dependent hydrolase (beta-lactamase superfamily II)
MKPITITCLGHGGAFSPLSVGNTSFLVDFDRFKILVDCGTTVPESLAEIGVKPGEITHCIITHLHADHVGGLERLLYHRRYIDQAARLPLIMGEEVADAWIDVTKRLRNDLDSHALVNYIAPGGGLSFDEDVEISCRRVCHGGDVPTMPGYCFLLELGSSAVFFSGDRIWKHENDTLVRKDMAAADLAFHEIELSPNPSGAHTYVQELLGERGLANVVWTHHGKAGSDYEGFPLCQRGDQWTVEGRTVTKAPNLYTGS